MIGRRGLFSALPLLGIPDVKEAPAKKDVLFRFAYILAEPLRYFRSTGGSGDGRSGGFLFSEVAGYYDTKIADIAHWDILLKNVGQSHTLDQETFERFEREYIKWHG